MLRVSFGMFPTGLGDLRRDDFKVDNGLKYSNLPPPTHEIFTCALLRGKEPNNDRIPVIWECGAIPVRITLRLSKAEAPNVNPAEARVLFSFLVTFCSEIQILWQT